MRIPKSNIFKSKSYSLVLISIVLVGLALRLYNLGGDPLWKTELYQAWMSKNFIEGTGFVLPGEEVFYERALITSTIPIVLSFSLLGYSEFAARLPSVVFGVLTILAVYFLAREVQDEEYGLIVSFVLALSYWSITWSTQARMYAHAQFFYVLGIIMLLFWYRDGFELRNRYFLYFLVVSLLGFHNHIVYSGIFAVLAVFIVLTLFEQFKENNLDNNIAIRKIRVLLSITVLVMVYIAVRGIPVWFLGYTPGWYNETRGVVYYVDWLNQYIPYMFLVASGTVIGVFKRKYWLISLSFLVPFILHSTLFEFKEPRYIFHLYPLLLMIASLPIYHFHKFLTKSTKLSKISSGAALIILVMILQGPFTSISEIGENSHGMIGHPPDHEGPAEYIRENKGEEDLIISTEPIKTQWYMGSSTAVDYDLNQLNSVNQSGEVVDKETGVEIIDSAHKMEKVIENNSGWIVLSNKNFNKRTPEEVREVILNEDLETIKDEDWTDTRVLRFQH